jgi:hypothetical protein
MWLIADDGGIEQPGGSILHQCAHAPDLKRPFDPMRGLWQLPNWNCRMVSSGDDLLFTGSLLAHATGFVAQELLVIVQIAVEGLDATLGHEPELVAYRAQQGPVVTDQHHCAFEFVECHA